PLNAPLHRLEVCRRWQFEGDGAPPAGVFKRQSPGVEHLPGRAGIGLTAIELVPQKWVIQAGHVDTDLMGATSFQPTCQFADCMSFRIFTRAQRKVKCQGRLAAMGRSTDMRTGTAGSRPIGSSTLPSFLTWPWASAMYSRRTVRACSCLTRSV